MSKIHLTDNKFMNWRGWDVVKWIFSALILVVVLWMILLLSTGRSPIHELLNLL